MLYFMHSFPDGWCADSNQQGEKWIEFDLGSSGLGINGVIIGPLKSAPKNYFKTVLVQYAPVGSSNLTDFHFFNAKKFVSNIRVVYNTLI